ncbi:MAG: hypothetical protein D6798_00145 [Deltaproteobacteria bacterium]|nr:MAG: hypothetical protein D6798_00145 [Deltaproteobacteria bacterium]
MFVFTVGTMRRAFATHLPRSSRALDAIADDPGRLSEVWPEMDATSIDYGIMERADAILTVPCDPGWSDVGAWPAAGELMPELEGGVGRVDAAVAIDSSGNILHAPGKVVALVGVRDLVVVDTDDAVLVMDRARAQDLPAVLRALQQRGLDRAT